MRPKNFLAALLLLHFSTCSEAKLLDCSGASCAIAAQDPTTTPATTAPTTTPLSTTTEHWPEPGMIFQLISYISARAMEVYQSDLNNYNKIHAHLDLHDCMYPAQVWKLELNGSDYIFQSALGGSNQWNHIMNRCRPSPTYPCIVTTQESITDGTPHWRVTNVPRTPYYTITNVVNETYNTIRYTGVSDAYGIKLDLAPLDQQDTAQWWEFRRC